MKTTYIMSCVWLDYMVKYFQCKNCVGSSLKTKKCVASFLVPGDKPAVSKLCTAGFLLFQWTTRVGVRLFGWLLDREGPFLFKFTVNKWRTTGLSLLKQAVCM